MVSVLCALDTPHHCVARHPHGSPTQGSLGQALCELPPSRPTPITPTSAPSTQGTGSSSARCPRPVRVLSDSTRR